MKQMMKKVDSVFFDSDTAGVQSRHRPSSIVGVRDETEQTRCPAELES